MDLSQAVFSFKEILSNSNSKEDKSNRMIRVITHIDTDGLMSGSIMCKALKKIDCNFWISAVKQLEEPFLIKLANEAREQKWSAVFFLDLGSGNLETIAKISEYSKIFILDHHEIQNYDKIKENKNIFIVNPMLSNNEKISGAGVTYLFCKEFSKNNRDLAQFAVLGMIGDLMDKEKDKKNNEIFEDARENGMQVKKGLTIFAGTRPIHKALEYSYSVFIPGVTGSSEGAYRFVDELAIKIKDERGYRTMIDLTDDEMSRLITAILLKRIGEGHNQDILGNVYLMKFYGHLFDGRELSAMINACGRLGQSELALAFALGSNDAKDQVETIYTKYKQHIIKSLNWIYENEKIQGSNYIIVNARNAIKDTIIGTVTSILASSSVYPKGTVLVGLAYREDDKIKVSARLSGSNIENTNNLFNLLKDVVGEIGGEVGGHANAAGCLISKSQEGIFLDSLQKTMSLQQIKI